MFRKLIVATLLSLSLCVSVIAQQTQSGLNTEIAQKLPSGTQPGINALNLRQVLTDMVVATFQPLTATQVAIYLGNLNPAAPSISLYNSTDISTQNNYSTGGGTTSASYRIQLIQNRAGLISQTIQNTNNVNEPSAVNGSCWLRAGGDGDQCFGQFGQAIAEVAGGASHELDAYNNSVQDAPSTVPRGDSFGTTSTWTTALALASGGLKNNWAALYIVQDGSTAQPQFNYGIYQKPPAVKVAGLWLDADATHSPTNTAIFKNTGLGSNIDVILQTMGTTTIGNSVFQHLNAGGLPTFQILQTGAITMNSTIAAPAITAAVFSIPLWAVVDQTNGFTLSSAQPVLDTYSGSSGCVASCAGGILARTGRGTAAAPVSLATNDIVMSIAAVPCVGGPPCALTIQQPAIIRAVWTDSGSNQGMAWDIYTSPNGATGNRAFAARIQGSGGVSVGTTTDPGIGKISANVGFSAAGAAGQSVTTTVRASGGASDCTLTFTGGIKTGGSC